MTQLEADLSQEDVDDEIRRPASPMFSKNAKKMMEMNRNGAKFEKIHHIPLADSALVTVLHVESPSSIWVRPFNHIADQLLLIEPTPHGQKLLQYKIRDDSFLNKYCMAPLPSIVKENEEGEATKRKRYGRARIVQQRGRLLRVLYIDEGVLEWVHPDCLAVMPDMFYYHPWQAMYVCLSGVQPNNFNLAPRWLTDDVILLRKIVEQYPLFKIVNVKSTLQHLDYSRPHVVDLFGMDSREEETESVCIATLLVAQSNGAIECGHVKNSHTYPMFKPPLVSKVELVLQPHTKEFPQWEVEQIEEWKLKQQTGAYKAGEEQGWIFDAAQPEFQIGNIDWEYLRNNRLIGETTDGVTTFSIVGQYTQHPYEFYGMPFRTKDLETGEPLRCRATMGSVYKERKERSEELDGFYSNKDHRFPLEREKINEWLEKRLRVYAIHNCGNLTRRKKSGHYQRVEIIGMASSDAARVRYLDTGGISAEVSLSDIHKINKKHCEWPSLCVQLCWHGVKDPDGSYSREQRFSQKVTDTFKENFFDDGPVRLMLLGQCPANQNCKYGQHLPEPHKMWNTMFVGMIELDPSISDETNLLKILTFDGKLVEGRLEADGNEPIRL